MEKDFRKVSETQKDTRNKIVKKITHRRGIMWAKIKQFFKITQSKDKSGHRCATTKYEDLCQ